MEEKCGEAIVRNARRNSESVRKKVGRKHVIHFLLRYCSVVGSMQGI
jgi:hypothetical protein